MAKVFAVVGFDFFIDKDSNSHRRLDCITMGINHFATFTHLMKV